MNDFQSLCAHYGIRATTVRRQLLELLRNISPVLAAEYIDIAHKEGFDTVTVYRTIALFTKLGLVYEFGAGKQRTLQLHEPSHNDHHHFIRCNRCDQVARFEDSMIEQKLTEISRQKGFAKIESHYLEVIGTCIVCYQLSRTV